MPVFSWVFASVAMVVTASRGNPVTSVLVVGLFYVAFNLLEAMIEKLIWGKRFVHWLDPVFALGFVSYAGLTVWACSVLYRG